MSQRSIFRPIPSLVWCLLMTAASAAPVQFTIDDDQSQITLSGSVAGNTLREQGPGSLNTVLSGNIIADVGAASIQFTGGSTLTAKTNGVWRPGPGGEAGTAPANYAAQASTFLGTIYGALRNLVLDLTSGPLPVTNGQFDAAELLFGFPANSSASFDYDAGFLGSDGIALSGIATNKIVNGATLSGGAGARTLTIQVDTEFTFSTIADDDSKVRLVGTLVATEASAPVPTITSIEVTNDSVVLRVQGGGSEPRLDSSSDLASWSTRTPARSSDANGVILTLPKGGPQEFYRVAAP